MANDYIATIKLLYPVAAGASYTLQDIVAGKEFDVIADVEIGRDLNDVVDRFDLRLGVVNLTTAGSVAVVDCGAVLKPADAPLIEQRRVSVPGGWTAARSGDVLQVVASYKVTAGSNVETSTAQSSTFCVI